MNKTELVAAVAAKAGISKKDADAAVAAVFASVTDALANGDKVQLIGFGTFEVRERAAKEGRNPKTGEKIAIALALRLGITQAMANGELDTILLDEPTIHLDSSRKHELINLLKEMSSMPQMIIVTHESQLENAADNLIKVEKENGISKVIM